MLRQPVDLHAVKRDAVNRFGQEPGVEGIGIGDQVLRIYIRNAEAKERLPSEFRGVPVEFVVTGDISSDW